MNVTELARRLRVHPKRMLEILPEHGFDIGAKAVKVDDRVANKIIRQWKFIKKEIGLLKLLFLRKLKFKGKLTHLKSFGKCFP